MNRTFDDATMDLPVALVLIAAAVAVTLAIGIAAVVRQNRAKAARRALIRPKPQPTMCDCCRTYRARTLATDHDLKPVRVCFGCLDEGFVRGWWATETTGAAS